jgi:homoserine kinase type II
MGMTDPETELKTVLAHYDLGILDQSERDERGMVNTSYIIDLQKDGVAVRYFLRRYQSGIRQEEIVFEHALIDHLAARGTCPVARVHRARNGASFIQLDVAGAAYYALFDYLPGEDRYTWVNPRCSLHEIRAAGALLAQFHSDVATLKAPGRRAEPKIVDLLPLIENAWSECLARSTGNSFDRYAAQHDRLVRDSLAEVAGVLRRATGDLPEVIIHSDYHPGNLRFLEDEISGLVDFDWAKVDLRSFDVALAVWYFCVSWQGSADGHLRIGAARTFLGAYQTRLMQGAELAPLSRTELDALPHLIAASNLYVLYWGLRDYLSKPVDPQEYLVYLRHSTRFARWFEGPSNRASLRAMLTAPPRPKSGSRERGGRSQAEGS